MKRLTGEIWEHNDAGDHLPSLLRKFAPFNIAIIAMIAALVLFGWQFDIDFLKRPLSGLAAMNPVTAFTFLLCSISISFFFFPAVAEKFRLVPVTLAIAAITIGLIRLIELITGIEFGVDQVLFHHKLSAESPATLNHIGSNTAASFMILGTSLILSLGKKEWQKKCANYCAFAIFSISLFSFVGYIYHVREFNAILSFIPMAIHTSVCFMLVALAVLFLNGRSGFMNTLTSPYLGGRLARQLIPFIIIVPLAMGFIRLYFFWRSPYSVELGVTYLIISIIIVFYAVVWFLSGNLNKADHSRVSAQEQLISFNQQLEQKIEERTRELKNNERRFRALVENNFEAIAVQDKDLKVIYRSPASTRMTGWTEEDRSKRPGIDTVHPEDQPVVKMIVAKVLANPGHPYPLAFRTMHKRGDYIWFEGVMTNLLHVEGVNGIVSNFRDVTAEKKFREKLSKSEALFKAISENSSDMIMMRDETFRLTYVNDAVYQLTGYSREEMMSTTGLLVVHEDDMEKWISLRYDMLANPGKPLRSEFRIINKNGDTVWIDGIGINFLDDPNIKAIVTTTRDITAAKIAEEKVLRANRLFAFISQINQAIVHVKHKKELLDKVCDIAHEYGKYRMSWIGMLDETREKIRFVAQSGFNDDDFNTYMDIAYHDDQLWPALFESAISSGTYAVGNNIKNDCGKNRWTQDAVKLGYRSSIVLPIKTFGSTIGIFCFNSHITNFFDEQEIELLKEAAGDVSFALENFEKERMKLLIEEKLEQNEYRLRKAQQIAHIGIWETDISSGKTIWSDEVRRLLGLSVLEKMAGTLEAIFEFIHPEDLDFVKNTLSQRRAAHHTTMFYRIVRKDGTLRHIYSESRYEYDKSDNPVRILGIMHDITESREAEIQLAKSEKRFRSLIENNYDVITLMDENLKNIYRSPSGERVTGWSNSDQDGATRLSDVHPDDLDALKHAIRKIQVHPGKPEGVMFRMKHKAGHYIWVEGLINNMMHDENIGAYLFNYHDITERKKSDADLLALNEELENKVEERTKEVNFAFNSIQEQNRQITDSIQYARRIQKAIVPRSADIAKSFPNHFVYYKPSNIVSGDFYWHHTKGDYHFIAAIDCTGHGVPGAMMSVIANELLNRAVIEYELTDPAEIFHSVDAGLSRILHHTGTETDLHDGMDIILCVIHKEMQIVSFSSALRPLFYVTGGVLQEVRASRQPLGSDKTGAEKTFETRYILYTPGDRIYLTSDGYYSQFGGEFGKKMTKKNFKKILQEFSETPVFQQKEFLHLYLKQWQGDEEQVDDILVIGIEL